MKKAEIWKWLILICLVAWSLSQVVPIDKIKLGLDLRGGTSFTMEIDDSEMQTKKEKADLRARALEIIRNRVDAFGKTDPIIYPIPNSNQIVVQIPGLKEVDRDNALKALTQKAFLEFRMVHEKNDELVAALFEKNLAPNGYKIITFSTQNTNGKRIDTKYYKRIKSNDNEDADLDNVDKKRIKRFEAPSGYDFMLMKEELKEGISAYRPYFVKRRNELTGEFISSARVDYNNFKTQVALTLEGEGKRRFKRVTEDNAPGGAKNPSKEGRRYLGIILDGTLYSAPFLRTPIYNGRAVIEGSFSAVEAQRLVTVLQAGSLPTETKMIEERSVDPSLGKDSIKSGKRASIFAGIAVVAFMLLYYFGAGVIANLALVLDILLLPLGMLLVSGFLSFFTGQTGAGSGGGLPTLTLPGIAGIVLTIGMAVDANVLIFERIREEHLAGKRFIPAVAAGYEKAFRTIFDANITTLLTAVILFWQGSGPVRGFAITLSGGIVASMYTALVVTRMLFNLVGEHSKVETIKMMRLIGDTKIDFIGKRKIAAMVSGLILVGTWGAFIYNGENNFGVDFSGGAALTFSFDEKVETQDVRDTLTAAGIENPTIQYQKVVSADNATQMEEFMELKVGHEYGDLARKTIVETFAAKGYKNIKTDSVGPQVGRELKSKGIKAIVFALVGIVIYISLRFEFAFAMGAIVAILHDVLITIGIFCILGNQLNLTIVAALLTIVGYSVNDTIVVFDRIREDLKLMKGKNYKDICNISINQTLSRTLLTSFTTLLSVGILLLFGGAAIFGFALALFIGVVVGTYSSIFVATPIVLLWHKEAKK